MADLTRRQLIAGLTALAPFAAGAQTVEMGGTPPPPPVVSLTWVAHYPAYPDHLTLEARHQSAPAMCLPTVLAQLFPSGRGRWTAQCMGVFLQIGRADVGTAKRRAVAHCVDCMSETAAAAVLMSLTAGLREMRGGRPSPPA